jgi:Leucine-rich repeat (LRR) protein
MKYYLLSTLLISSLILSQKSFAQNYDLENEVSVNIDSLFSNTHYLSLNKALLNPDKVYSLDLSMQKIEELGDSISLFVNLESLDISFNRFKTLPESIISLPNLKYLSISGCYDLETIPDNLQKLSNLEELRVEDMMALPHDEIQRAIKALPWAKVYF